MSYWHYLLISGAVIVFAILLYLILRWRKAPRAFKVMNLVSAASLAAGVLLGIWGMHMIDIWMNTGARGMESTPSTGSSASATSSSPGTPTPEVTPIGTGTTPILAPDHVGTILASYVGQALSRGYAKITSTGGTEAWPQVDQGCRLGNYEPTSALCRAAALAAQGWGDTRSIPFDEVVEFCDADYLADALALCVTARHLVGPAADSMATERIPSVDVKGIPESDVAEALGTSLFGGTVGPDGKYNSWRNVVDLCERGTYASISPVCEAAAVRERSPHDSARLSYSEVASFCDVKLITAETEVCRAAYRFSKPTSKPAR
jgi:hypothetical protein